MFGGRTPDQRKESSRLMKILGKIEARYDKEDQDMISVAKTNLEES